MQEGDRKGRARKICVSQKYRSVDLTSTADSRLHLRSRRPNLLDLGHAYGLRRLHLEPS